MDKIDAFPKPEGKESQASDFSAGMRKTATLLKKTATAIRDNDETAGKQVTTDLLTEVKATRDQASALGIGKCNPPAADSLGG
jgi:K+-transporting ATPase c subunit